MKQFDKFYDRGMFLRPKSWIQFQFLYITTMTLGKLINISEPQFAHQ